MPLGGVSGANDLLELILVVVGLPEDLLLLLELISLGVEPDLSGPKLLSERLVAHALRSGLLDERLEEVDASLSFLDKVNDVYLGVVEGVPLDDLLVQLVILLDVSLLGLEECLEVGDLIAGVRR